MKKLSYWSMDHPKWVILLTLAVTLFFLIQFPRAIIDTDPENMLEPDQPDRVLYDQVKKDFGVYDLIVVGIIDERGIFRPQTLERLARVADGILGIEGVIAEDVMSFSTTDDVSSADGTLRVAPIMERPPEADEEAGAIRRAALDNPMFAEKLASLDGTAAALYVPIERKDQSYRISKEIEAILKKELGEGQRYHIAGLSVAEDTFGFEMFLQMGIMAPLAMGVIFALMFSMFRQLALIVPPMVVAMLSVVWGMGALIGMGFTVHIMSSMIPVFLMPIAVLDTVHILSEFYDRYSHFQDRRKTLHAVFEELFSPMLYTSLTSAVGFASLTLAPIPPVRVFGGFVAFGIMAAWLLTVTLIPASVMLTREERLAAKVGGRQPGRSLLERALPPVGRFAFRRSKAVVLGAVVLLGLGIWGIARIAVNDNPVKWFKPEHKIRLADEAMNRLFGGTYMAYLVVEGSEEEAIKQPQVMAYIDRLQARLESEELVGKTSSVADIAKRVNYVLLARDAVPATQEEIGQYLFLFLMAGDPDDLDNFVDYEYRRANIWVQLKGGDNQDMEAVEEVVQAFLKEQPPPEGIQLRWSGLTYINKVWQGLMVVGMRNAVLGGFAAVFALMLILFRSFGLALISMMPLTFAIVLSYGIVGFIGKDYDMPIAVCSSLALGLSIDFAIHFVQRFRRKCQEIGELEQVNAYMFGGPGRAIARNGIVIAVGFLPLGLATLTPYVTVGAFFASLMAASALTTLVLLPALMRLMGGRLCRPLSAKTG
jgi:predicted RND superfamily exporter protein